MSSSRVRLGTEKIRGEVYVKCWGASAIGYGCRWTQARAPVNGGAGGDGDF